MLITVTRSQHNLDYSKNYSATVFRWSDEEPQWSQDGNYREFQKNLIQEITIYYRSLDWTFCMDKVVYPIDDVDVDIACYDIQNYHKYTFSDYGYSTIDCDEVIVAHDSMTRNLWDYGRLILETLFKAKDQQEFEAGLNLCCHIKPRSELPGFYYHKLESIGISSERISPPNNSSSDDPSIDTCSDNSCSEKRSPIGITSPGEEKISEFISNKIDDQKQESVTIGGEEDS